MLCRCCYDMEMYELVGRLYILVQQDHGSNMLQMGWSFHGPEHEGIEDKFLMSLKCSIGQEKISGDIRMCILVIWAYG